MLPLESLAIPQRHQSHAGLVVALQQGHLYLAIVHLIVGVHACAYACMHVSMYACMHVYMYACMRHHHLVIVHLIVGRPKPRILLTCLLTCLLTYLLANLLT